MACALRPVHRNLEPGLADSVQVVREAMGERLHGVHAEGQSEILGQAFDGHEKVTGQSAIDGRFVSEVDPIPFR